MPLRHIRQFLHLRQETITSASFVLAINFLLSAVLGFLRSRILYSHFYTCCPQELDAYNAAFRLPDLVFKLLVSGALSASFIPVFSQLIKKDAKKAYEIASSVINSLLFLLIVASVVIFIFSVPFSRFVAPGFNPYQIELMSTLTRILLFGQLFFLLSNFLTAILQVHHLFLISSMSPIVYNIFIILSIYTLTPSLGIYGVAIGAVVGAFFHLFIQLPFLRRVGFSYSRKLDIKTHEFKEIVHLMVPRTVSLGLGEIENTVTLFFASTLTQGSISLFNLALQLMYLPSRIFGATLGQASLPILSKNFNKDNQSVFRSIVNRTLLQSIFLALPVTILIVVLRLPLVRLAFGTRQFPWSATLLTAKALAFLSPAIFCQSLIQILNRSFYAMHDTQTPLKISLASLVVNVISSFYFITYTSLGIIGLSISASLGNLVQFLGLAIGYISKVDGNDWFDFWSQVKRLALANLATFFFAWATLRILDNFIFNTTKVVDVALILSVSSILSLTFYVILGYLLKINEVTKMKSLLRRFF